MRIEWSHAALADLDRFAEFLNERHPSLAAKVAQELIAKSETLLDHPYLGRPIDDRAGFRQVVMQVLNAACVFQYRVEDDRIVMTRIYHGREDRNR